MYSCAIYLQKARGIIHTNVATGRAHLCLYSFSHADCKSSSLSFQLHSLSFILQMSASFEPLGDSLSLSWTSCLISLFFSPRLFIRQNLSLLLRSQNGSLTDTLFWGAGTPSHPPSTKRWSQPNPKALPEAIPWEEML